MISRPRKNPDEIHSDIVEKEKEINKLESELSFLVDEIADTLGQPTSSEIAGEDYYSIISEEANERGISPHAVDLQHQERAKKRRIEELKTEKNDLIDDLEFSRRVEIIGERRSEASMSADKAASEIQKLSFWAATGIIAASYSFLLADKIPYSASSSLFKSITLAGLVILILFAQKGIIMAYNLYIVQLSFISSPRADFEGLFNLFKRIVYSKSGFLSLVSLLASVSQAVLVAASGAYFRDIILEMIRQ